MTFKENQQIIQSSAFLFMDVSLNGVSRIMADTLAKLLQHRFQLSLRLTCRFFNFLASSIPLDDRNIRILHAALSALVKAV
jgi:hypothetical protein